MGIIDRLMKQAQENMSKLWSYNTAQREKNEQAVKDFSTGVQETVKEDTSAAVEWVDNTVIEPVKDAGKDAVEWVDNTVIEPVKDAGKATVTWVKDSWETAGDWVDENVKNPISKTWDKYKIPILAGAGAVAAIKILK